MHDISFSSVCLCIVISKAPTDVASYFAETSVCVYGVPQVLMGQISTSSRYLQLVLKENFQTIQKLSFQQIVVYTLSTFGGIGTKSLLHPNGIEIFGGTDPKLKACFLSLLSLIYIWPTPHKQLLMCGQLGPCCRLLCRIPMHMLCVGKILFNYLTYIKCSCNL